MSTATTPAPASVASGVPGPSPASFEPPLWPISVALYTRMVYAGILGKYDRVYLWKGRLAPKMTKHRPHCVAVRNTYNALYVLHLEGYTVEQESPMALRLEPSVPEPDVLVFRGGPDAFPHDYPTTADVPLVVEVSESTLAEDRALAFTYAAEGIPVYWLVNIPGRRVEVFTEPAEGAYTRCTPHGPDDMIPVVLDGREVGRIAVRDVLP
jgi:Uma2 family endonuclease